MTRHFESKVIGRVQGIGLAILVFAASVLVVGATADAADPSCERGPETAFAKMIGTACADVIVAEPGVKEIDAGPGDDTIYATHAVEIVRGGEGDDTIVGEIPDKLENGATEAAESALPGAAYFGDDGDDLIYATDWVVSIDGGAGDDTLYGEIPESVVGHSATPSPSVPGNPQLGSEANSTLGGAAIQAAPTCSPSPPITYCGLGNQIFRGGTGADIAFGQRGNDIMYGNEGNDQLFGGIGDEQDGTSPGIRGGPGNDLLSGGMGADRIEGGGGSDVIRGDGTVDYLQDSGSSGIDTISYASGVTPGFSGPGPSGVPGFPGANQQRGVYVRLDGGTCSGGYRGCNGSARYGGGFDEIEVNLNPSSSKGFENVIGTPFSDYIVGSNRANGIFGGGGADVIRAGNGNDYVIGGADGDHIEGGNGADALVGNAGDDYCAPATANCERNPANDPDGGVDLRNSGKISVGFMNTDFLTLPYVQIYLAGSNVRDNVNVYYTTDQYGTSHVTFVALSDSARFDVSTDAGTYLCTFVNSAWVSCALPRPLDTLVLAGLDGNDKFTPTGFPPTTSVVELGGEGSDQLSGSTGGSANFTEDMLVDGPGNWNDPALKGFAGDDILINNGGTDGIYGGNGNDLLLSASVCDGDTLAGGSGVDNASWAKLNAPARTVADLAEGTAGNQKGGQGKPYCGGSGTVASLSSINDLEGSSQNDGLYGGGGKNQLLGRLGSDGLVGRNGIDSLLARSAEPGDPDIDQAISCGPPSGNELATRDPGDPSAPDC